MARPVLNVVFVFLISLCTSSAEAQTSDLAQLEEETVSRLQEYLRVDTTNPPGNESRAVEFFGRILTNEGIPFETAESAPGRGNLWARLEGGPEPAIILLNHTDVVPADESYWDLPPLSGEIQDGFLYGRGALDMKTLGMLQFQAFLALHRSGKPLKRPVIFMATADEEAGGLFGAGWLVKNRREIFDGVGWLLTEGGGGSLDGGHEIYSIEVTQKVPLWLRLKATGIPGHGSTPRVETSVTRLIRALNLIREHQPIPRIIPAVDTYFKGLADLQTGELRSRFQNMAEAVKDPDFMLALQLENPGFNAITRNTCSITSLQGSSKINVVPPEVSAEIDCRLLPDQDHAEFISELETLINDPMVTIEKIMAFSPAISTTDTDLYRAIESVCTEHFPNVKVLPSVLTGFTDAHYMRDLGIASYGFSPSLIPVEESAGVHGNNERISTENVGMGVGMLLEILERVVY